MTFVVVDDDEMDRYIARRRLSVFESFGEVYEIESGQDFIRLICDSDGPLASPSTPIVVLMDINMPGLDGFETAEQLRLLVEKGQVPPSVVVMMFSSSENPHDRERAEQNSIIKGYVVKPIDDAAISALERVIESLGPIVD
ncbi:MAG: response regulator [Pseudomonadota bacterium]